MKNSINDLFSEQVLETKVFNAEAFSYTAQTKDADLRFQNRVLDGCFGRFTHNMNLLHDKVVKKCSFNYHFNLLSTYEQKQSGDSIRGQFISDIDNSILPGGLRSALYIADGENKHQVLLKELKWLEEELQQYVPFYMELDSWNTYKWVSGHDLLPTNSFIRFDFENVYMWEIFLVLTCFRKLLQITSYAYYQLAKELYAEQWHHLEFINILLLMDATDIHIPSDQKLGHMFLNVANSSWISKATIEHNRKHLPLNAHFRYEHSVVPLDNFYTYRSKTSVYQVNLEDVQKWHFPTAGSMALGNLLNMTLKKEKMELLYEMVNIKND